MNLKTRFSPAAARLAQVQIQFAGKSLGISAGFIISCLVLSAGSLTAQVNTGSLSGLVLDQSGAAVAGTELTVKSGDTGYTRTGRSLADGAYSLPDLPIGNYSLTASASGFSRFNRFTGLMRTIGFLGSVAFTDTTFAVPTAALPTLEW